MVRYMLSLNWTSLIRSTLLSAFEAYGSALVGVAPIEASTEIADRSSAANVRATSRH